MARVTRTPDDKKGKRDDKVGASSLAGPVEGAQATPLMNCAALAALLRLGESHGLPRSELLQACGLSLADLDDPDAHFPYAVGLMLWAKAQECASQAHLGLEFAAMVSATERDLPRHVLAHCPDLRTAVKTLVEIQSLVDSASPVRLEPAHAGIRIAFVLPRGFESLHQPFEGLVAATFAIFARLVGPAFAITEVGFEHPRRLALAPYAAFFGREPEFAAPSTFFTIPTHVLDLPILDAQPALGRHLAEHARHLIRERQTLLEKTPPEDPFLWTGRVAQLLNDRTAPIYELASIARRLGIGVRTLQRRLLNEGQNFDALCDAARRERAGELLRDPSLSLTQVAQRLGYADRRSLSRAISRWMGERTAPNGLANREKA